MMDYLEMKSWMWDEKKENVPGSLRRELINSLKRDCALF